LARREKGIIERQLAGLTVVPIPRDSSNLQVKNRLTLVIEQLSDCVRGRLLYSKELYTSDTARRVIAEYEAVLAAMVERPHTQIRSLHELVVHGAVG
jgi:hypothetical protein